MLGLHGDVELDVMEHARGGEEAHVSLQEAPRGDLLALLTSDEGPELPQFDDEQTDAVRRPVVEHRARGHLATRHDAGEEVAIRVGEPIPEGKGSRESRQLIRHELTGPPSVGETPADPAPRPVSRWIPVRTRSRMAASRIDDESGMTSLSVRSPSTRSTK